MADRRLSGQPTVFLMATAIAMELETDVATVHKLVRPCGFIQPGRPGHQVAIFNASGRDWLARHLRNQVRTQTP
jgi:hypothetical protein